MLIKIFLSDRMIFYKRLHCLIGCKAKTAVKLSSGTVAVFSTLPEQAVVVAKERSVLHLRLVLEDGVAFEAELLWTHRHCHLDVVDFPFCPCAAVHPDAAFFHPFCAIVKKFVNSGENSVGADTVSAMRVGKVASHENLMRLD